MSTFKVGDKVRALSSGHHLITEDGVYTVVGTDDRSHGGELVYVTGNNGLKAGQYAYRFEAVEADPVFTVGQRVKITSYWDSRGLGRVLEWKDPKRRDGKLIAVAHETWDGGHAGWDETTPSSYTHRNNVWFYDPQCLAPAEEARRFIVILEKNGQLLPSTTPREYKTREQAEHVAKDMTKKHKGNFYVFESSFLAKPVTKVVETVEAEGVKL
jgi:hypothetical protein